MKVFLLWLVAARVVAVTTVRPCAEYCVYLSSSNRDIEWQPGCDCMYKDDEYQKQIDQTSIYYEPVDYVPLPVYNHKRPFYILNPKVGGKRPYSTDNRPVSLKPSLNSHTNEIDPNVENLQVEKQSTYNRQQKDIKFNKQRLSAPLYLDINVESEEVERSASSKSLKAEELILTEQRLLECTNMYSALHSRKNIKEKGLNNKLYLSEEYPNLSNEELTKILRDKCSHISYIIEESLNEIKKTRSKVTSVRFRMDGDDQNNIKTSHRNIIHHTTENDCTSSTENNSQSSIQNEYTESGIKEYTENQEQTTVTSTESDEKTHNLKTTTDILSTITYKVNTSTLEDSSKGAPATASSIYTTTQDFSTEFGKTSIDQSSTLVYAQNETTTLSSIATTSETATSTADMATANTIDKIIFKDQDADQNVNTTEVERHSENRARYEDGEVPLVKIITHEFSNDTVQSFINGTEDIPNGDFDEVKPNEVDHSTRTSVELETTTSKAGYNVTEPDITGNLYFLFNKHQIPAKFVQNSNGSLFIGIDGVTLCDTLTQNDRNSVLLKSLCKCYKTGNCTHNDTD